MDGVYNSRNDNDLDLTGFANYLVQRSLVPEVNARFYVQWVRKFMESVPANPSLGLSDRLTLFLDTCGKSGVQDWQIKQAERAVEA